MTASRAACCLLLDVHRRASLQKSTWPGESMRLIRCPRDAFSASGTASGRPPAPGTYSSDMELDFMVMPRACARRDVKADWMLLREDGGFAGTPAPGGVHRAGGAAICRESVARRSLESAVHARVSEAAVPLCNTPDQSICFGCVGC